MKRYLIILVLLLIAPLALQAQGFQFDPGGTIANSLKLPKNDAESLVVDTVQWILGLLGLFAVITILYGGFRYLTSGGNEETIKNAKAILKTSVIGLTLVLFSWAIIRFVVSIFG